MAALDGNAIGGLTALGPAGVAAFAERERTT